MNKRILAASTSLAFVISAHAQATISAKAREIHNSAIVIDTHADTPQRFLDENYDIGSTDPKNPGHISLDKAKAGNLGAEFFSIWGDPETNPGPFARPPLVFLLLVGAPKHNPAPLPPPHARSHRFCL